MARTVAVLLAWLACPALVMAQTYTGDQPVVVLYTTVKDVPAWTLAGVKTQAAASAKAITDSSYGTYRLIVQAYGPYRVPSTLACGGYAQGPAAEAAARAAGVTFPAGVSPWTISDCGGGHIHNWYTSTVPGAKQGIFSNDGKEWPFEFGHSIGLGHASAEVIPPIGTNTSDPYTPMGQGSGTSQYSGHERVQLQWIPTALMLADPISTPSVGTQFIEVVEAPPTNKVKIWKLSNGVNVEIRRGMPVPVVTVRLGNTLLDLDRVHLCRWYTLKLGQIYTRGDGIGITPTAFALDGSGATISVFPYTGPSTAQCPSGSK